MPPVGCIEILYFYGWRLRIFHRAKAQWMVTVFEPTSLPYLWTKKVQTKLPWHLGRLRPPPVRKIVSSNPLEGLLFAMVGFEKLHKNDVQIVLRFIICGQWETASKF
jgi:hypothetical protein